MKSLLYKFIIAILAFIICKSDEPVNKGYEDLLKWGKDNFLNITDKIKFVKNKDIKQYIAKNLIPEDDIIMEIPPECMMNVNKALDLLNSKKFRKAYDAYVEEDKHNTNVIKDDNHVDQAFLSYILYIMNHKKKMYEKNKNKFYEFYKSTYYMFEEDLDSLPFYFSSDQMRLFLNTSFGSIFEIINRYLNEEGTILEKEIFKKPLLFEEYLPYRIIAFQKSYEVKGKINIIPFIDYIRKDFKNVNCEFKQENGNIIIKATQNIFPGEELIMKPVTLNNHHRFIFFGETFDELLDKFQTFNIPSLIPKFISDKNVDFDVSSFGEMARVDLVDNDFYKKVLDVYKTFARMIKEDDSDVGATKLFLKFLQRIRSNFDYIRNEDIRNAFFKKKDISNVKRIFEGEKLFLDNAIDKVKIYLKDLRNKIDEIPDVSPEDINDL